MKNALYQLDAWTQQLLQQTALFFSQQPYQTYLVGGSVRNLLLQEPCTDWDIATSGDFTSIGRQLANHLHGFYAPLHNKACRIIVKHETQEAVIDIAPLHGNTIEADLHQRDFTLNAIASPFVDAIHSLTNNTPLPLIDPLHGEVDLQNRLLRATNEHVFRHDTLRMLRAIRFMMRYSLTLEEQTRQIIIRDAPLLLHAAGERIHEELYAILQPAGATTRLRLLDELGLFSVLFPELETARGMAQPSLHNWDVFNHSLEAVSTLERLTTTLQLPPDEIHHSPLEIGNDGHLTEIQSLLQEAEQQGIFSFATLEAPATKLAALLHDVGKPTTHAIDAENNITFYHHPQAGVPLAQQITQRLHLSAHNRRLIQQVVAHHMRPGQLSHDNVTQRAIRRYFVDLGPTGIIVALISLSDHLAMRGPQPLTEHWYRHLATVRLLLTRYIRERERILPPRLVQADELMRKFDLKPGPIIGQLLDYLAEAQAEGRVHSKEEALWLVEEKLQGNDAI